MLLHESAFEDVSSILIGRAENWAEFQTWSESKILLDPFKLTPRVMRGGFGFLLLWKSVFLEHPSSHPSTYIANTTQMF